MQGRAIDTGLRVLVIDDDLEVLCLMQEGLGLFGCTVWTACDGEAGISLWRDREVDVVICDLDMPKMSGWQVGKAIKELSGEQGKKKGPFAILTGRTYRSPQEQTLSECGVDVVLHKPISLHSLLGQIKKMTHY